MSDSAQPGAPYFVVLNPGSGHDDATVAHRRIAHLLSAAGQAASFVEFDGGRSVLRAARKAAAEARRTGGTVVACGGDGTINAVAAAAHAAGVPLGVIPQGTFNYFGRAHGIPADVGQAVGLMLASSPRAAQFGMVNGRPFLVNASIGLYPRLLEDREAWKQSLGRHRAVAILSAVVTMLRDHRMLALRVGLQDRDKPVLLRTPTLIVGNNPIQVERLGMDDSDAIGNGLLMAVALKPISKLGLLKLIVTGALGRLGESDDVVAQRCVRLRAELVGRWTRRPIKVALDGEVFRMRSPLTFEVSERPLQLRAARSASAKGDPG